MSSWSLVLAAAAATAPSPGEYLIHVVEDPPMRVDSLTVEGRLCSTRYRPSHCNRSVRASLQAGEQNLDVAIVVADSESLSTSIPISRLPRLDLATAAVYGHYSPELEITVEVKFGEPNDCYSNDDGRAKLSIVFGQDEKPYAHLTTFPECEVLVEELNPEG